MQRSILTVFTAYQVKNSLLELKANYRFRNHNLHRSTKNCKALLTIGINV